MPDLKLLTLTAGMLQSRPDVDLTFDGAGHIAGGPTLVSGKDAAAQDVVRALLTELGTNPLAQNFGTILSTLLNARSVGDVANQISQEVQAVMGYLSQVTADSDPSEQIVQITNLKVKQETQTIRTDLTLLTGTGQATVVTVG